VEGRDHHCPFADNCIGYKNHPWLLSFLIIFLLYNIAAITMITITIIELVGKDDDLIPIIRLPLSSLSLIIIII